MAEKKEAPEKEEKKDNNKSVESNKDKKKETKNSNSKVWPKIVAGAAAVGLSIGAFFGGRAYERKHPRNA